MTIRLTGMSRRSFLRTGVALGTTSGLIGLKAPALAQNVLPDIRKRRPRPTNWSS